MHMRRSLHLQAFNFKPKSLTHYNAWFTHPWESLQMLYQILPLCIVKVTKAYLLISLIRHLSIYWWNVAVAFASPNGILLCIYMYRPEGIVIAVFGVSASNTPTLGNNPEHLGCRTILCYAEPLVRPDVPSCRQEIGEGKRPLVSQWFCKLNRHCSLP